MLIVSNLLNKDFAKHDDTTYYLLLTTYYSLLTTYYSLLTTYYLLLTATSIDCIWRIRVIIKDHNFRIGR